MCRCISSIVVMMLVNAVHGAEIPVFKFKKDQILIYKVVQTTQLSETILDEKTGKPIDQKSDTRHTVIRCWKITAVDEQGTATMAMTIKSMKWNRTTSMGDSETFDSDKVDNLNKQEMTKLIGPVLAVIRVSKSGKLVEVKESHAGTSSRFATDLPLKVMLPEQEVAEGFSWDRTFPIVLDPPHGTGEKYQAVQKFTILPPENGYLTIGAQTTIKDMPSQPSEQLPLLALLMEGKVYVHQKSGKFIAARLKIRKEIMNHQGEGTKCLFESSYTEDLMPEE